MHTADERPVSLDGVPPPSKVAWGALKPEMAPVADDVQQRCTITFNVELQTASQATDGGQMGGLLKQGLGRGSFRAGTKGGCVNPRGLLQGREQT